MRIGRRAAKGCSLHDRQIRPVIAHDTGLLPAQSQRPECDFSRRQFVFSAEVGMDDAQSGQAAAQCGAVAPGDDGWRDAGFLQQFQTVPIECVEALECLAVLRHVQAAIGQHTIHIKKSNLDVLRHQQQLGRQLQDWHGQITLACIRSLALSAPQSTPWLSTTSTLVMQCCSISATAWTASASACTVCGLGCMTSTA